MRHWLKGAEIFESPELVSPQYAHMEGRIRYRDRVRQLMVLWLLQHGKQEIFHAGQARKLAWGYLATLQEVLESPQLQRPPVLSRYRTSRTGQISNGGRAVSPQ
uniref:CoA transferase n=1 Tax=Desertifilum tharense IPPAS B-1220 TaxID=1781255 RepID=A0ACD5H2F7_9CYAN